MSTTNDGTGTTGTTTTDGTVLTGTTTNVGTTQTTQTETDPLTGLSDQQVDDLAARIDEARKNRPAALADQLAALGEQLTGAHRDKDEAVDKRKEASGDADKAVELIQEIKDTMRRTELTEAATVAGFTAPAVVAAALSGQEGDVTALIADAAKSGAYAMKTPAKSAQIGGAGSQSAPEMDPGRAALIAEIAEATGRG